MKTFRNFRILSQFFLQTCMKNKLIDAGCFVYIHLCIRLVFARKLRSSSLLGMRKTSKWVVCGQKPSKENDRKFPASATANKQQLRIAYRGRDATDQTENKTKIWIRIELFCI